MKITRCLAVGVSDAPPLDYLPGAANGARAFADWARAQGYETELLTDESEPIELVDIQTALLRLLRGPEKIFRLLVYFAGHGVARDAAEDLWLLSRWREDQRAVAVNFLKRRLDRYGMDQITIVADACRSLPAGEEVADLASDPVLGRGPFDGNFASTDFLRASSSFQAAFMISGASEEEDRCIFSGVLEEALLGACEEAFEPLRGAVTSGSLKRFLEQEVPRRAAIYNVALRPNIVPGFIAPDDVYVSSKPAQLPALRVWPAATGVIGAMGVRDGGARSGRRGWSTAKQAPIPSPRSARAKNTGPSILGGPNIFGYVISKFTGILNSAATSDHLDHLNAGSTDQQIKASPNSENFTEKNENRTRKFENSYASEDPRPTDFGGDAGFSIAGAAATAVVTGGSAHAYNEREGQWWRLTSPPRTTSDEPLHLNEPTSLLIQLESGVWIGAAGLPRFIGTFSVEQGGAVSLIYREPWRGEEYEWRKTERAVAQLRAGALAPEAAYDLAAVFREGKAKDPVRGLIAAYLYDAQADVESSRRTAYYLAAQNIPLPYDVALLSRVSCYRNSSGALMARLPATRVRDPLSRDEESRSWTFQATPEIEAQVGGAFPWLRQGWSLLDPGSDDPALVSNELAEIAKFVLPHPFTTLRPDGGRRLRIYLENNR